MMLFLGFWNSLNPPPLCASRRNTLAAMPFDYHFVIRFALPDYRAALLFPLFSPLFSGDAVEH